MKMAEGNPQGSAHIWSSPFSVFVLNVWDANINTLTISYIPALQL